MNGGKDERGKDERRREGELLVYQGEGLDQPIRVLLEGETVWLTQRLMAELFQIGVNTVNHHVKEIYDDAELLPEATIRKYRIVQTEGTRQVSRLVDHYNLEMILADDLKSSAETLRRSRKKKRDETE